VDESGIGGRNGFTTWTETMSGVRPARGSFVSNEIPALVARLVLAAVFIYMGLTKAMQPVEFLKLARQYDVLHHALLLNLVTAILPWLEMFCGLLLLFGIAVRGTAVVLLVMLVPFTVAVMLRAAAMRDVSGLPFCAIKFDCGCGAGEVLVCRKLGENLILMIFSAMLIFARHHRFCLRSSFF
jgi:uncharacterized membrane protein YphA (DoxX/SURF4 family)